MSGLEPGYPLGYLTKTMLSNNFTEKIVLKRKTWNKCIFLFSLLFLPNISEARVWKIKQRGTPGVDCDAVDFTEIYKWESVKPGDEIWVYPGIYDSLEITQKFSGTIWKAKDSENNDIIPKPGIENPVLIDGKGSYHVVTINAPNVIIQGFAVKGGSGDGWSQGTGIWIYNVPGIIVQDCLIYNNKNCGIYISNGVKDTIIRRCTLIGNNIVESGGQGVKNNFYQDNTLYEGYIYIYEWIDYKRNNGSTGKGNRCLTGQIGSNQLNPKYLPKLIIDHFPTYRKLLITINGRAMVIGAKLDSAEISIMDKNGKEIKTASIEKFNESINPNGTGDNELLQSRGSKKPEELKEYTGVGRVSLELPELSEGEYKVIAKLKGTELPEILEGSFKRIKLPWEKTDLGISDKVLPPWTPLELNKEKNSINCWSRKYHFANTGFLRQIETAGQAILTDQISLEGYIDGVRVNFKPKGEISYKNISSSRITIEGKCFGQIEGKSLDIVVNSEIEYDGFIKINLKIVPEKEITLDTLKLVIPLKSSFATHLHSAGPDMRASVFTDKLPDKMGKLWDSTMSRRQIHYSAKLTVGSFKPYIWIGLPGKGGLAYMADNDKGWFPNDKVPAFEVVKIDKNTTNFIFNFIADTNTITKPRTIIFSLQATPVKPLPKDFRFIAKGVDNLCTFVGYGKSYYNGIQEHPTGWDGSVPPGWDTYATSPFPIDWEKNKKYNEELAKEDRIYLPYQCLNYTLLATPVDPRTKGPEGKEWWELVHSEIECDGYGGWCLVPAHTEYRLYRYKQWIHENRIRGFYFDNAYPIICRKIETGCGYYLDDGRIQPGFTMFGMREFFKRLRNIIVEEGLEPCILTHSTDTFMAPAYSFVDIMMDGENFFITPDNPKFFSEIWTKEYFQTMTCPHHWGIITMFIPEFHGDWSKNKEWAKAQSDSFAGFLLLHDVEGNYLKHLWKGTIDLKKEAMFLPYWDVEVNKYIFCSIPDVLISGYHQDNNLSLIVFNHSREILKDVPIKINLSGLGITKDREKIKVVSINNKPYQTNEKGIVIVEVNLEPHNYQVVKVSY